MDKENPQQIALNGFADVAQQYCDWAESPFTEPHDEMIKVRKLLADLHATILNVELDDRAEETNDLTSTAQWHLVMSRSANLPIGVYWDVFNPMEEDNPVLNSLADDLSDIYRDLKQGLILFNQGKMAEAAWEWRLHFDIHWGQHLTGAQRAIHAYFS